MGKIGAEEIRIEKKTSQVCRTKKNVNEELKSEKNMSFFLDPFSVGGLDSSPLPPYHVSLTSFSFISFFCTNVLEQENNHLDFLPCYMDSDK